MGLLACVSTLCFAAPVPERRGPRSRSEIRTERKALEERTLQEIPEIAAEFHGMLPRKKADALGAMYVRFSSQFQDSIADQVRSLFDDAVKLKVFVPVEFIFFDIAVRGFKDRRKGLDELRGTLSKKSCWFSRPIGFSEKPTRR